MTGGCLGLTWNWIVPTCVGTYVQTYISSRLPQLSPKSRNATLSQGKSATSQANSTANQPKSIQSQLRAVPNRPKSYQSQAKSTQRQVKSAQSPAQSAPSQAKLVPSQPESAPSHAKSAMQVYINVRTYVNVYVYMRTYVRIYMYGIHMYVHTAIANTKYIIVQCFLKIANMYVRT